MKDYDGIRQSVQHDGFSAPVRVNQRALIEKILARYASKYSLYRELLQNSNDANATHAELLYTTTTNVPANKKPARTVHALTYRNDGDAFRDQDWDRLQSIADGNPDETKVGAFGVGAYTMFSITDSPLVVSGERALEFVWDGNALIARIAAVPPSKFDDKWTAFVMPSRPPGYDLPCMTDLGEFLCHALAFTRSLTSVAVYVDNVRTLTVSKTVHPCPTITNTPPGELMHNRTAFVPSSPNETFTLTTVSRATLRLHVRLRAHVFAADATAFDGAIAVALSAEHADRIARITKKRPPRSIHIGLFIPFRPSPHDDDSNDIHDEHTTENPAQDIVQRFLASDEPTGFVFIGFRSSQTTGVGVHVQAPLIPTVEREAVDLQDASVRSFNEGLLFVAGVLMRVGYDSCMSVSLPNSTTLSIAGVINNGGVANASGMDKNDDDDVKWQNAISVLRAFTPFESTPNAEVGECIAQGFTNCHYLPVPPVVPTLSGLRYGPDARLARHGLERFVARDVVPRAVAGSCREFLVSRAGCQELGVSDLVSYLRDTVVSEGVFVELLNWWYASCFNDAEFSMTGSISQLLEVTKFEPSAETRATLSTQPAFLNAAQFKHYCPDTFELSSDHDVPLPQCTLPAHLQVELTSFVLRSNALAPHFSPLPFLTWARFAAAHPCMTAARPHHDATRLRVLRLFSRELRAGAAGMGRDPYKQWVHDLFQSLPCIPTTGEEGESNSTPLNADGLDVTEKNAIDMATAVIPGNAYMPEVDISIFRAMGSFRKVSPAVFDAGVSREFLIAVGVRQSVSATVLLNFFYAFNWHLDTNALVTYFRKAALTAEDLDILRARKFLLGSLGGTTLHSPSELYLPVKGVSDFACLNVLHWAGEFDLHSPEGTFLQSIGCKATPPLQTLLQYTATATDATDTPRVTRCLKFITDKMYNDPTYAMTYSDDMKRIAFLPAAIGQLDEQGLRGPVVKRAPTQCWTDEELLAFGVPVLDPAIERFCRNRIAESFGCERLPSPSTLIDRLIEIAGELRHVPATSVVHAANVQNRFAKMFRILFNHPMELTAADKDRLCQVAFIPVSTSDGIRWMKKDDVCFDTSDDLVKALFATVRFDAFLQRLGVKSSPSPQDILEKVIKYAENIYSAVGEQDYLAILSRLAASEMMLSITPRMMKAKFLVGYRSDHHSSAPTQRLQFSDVGNTTTDSESSSIEVTLASGKDIYIVDETSLAKNFKFLQAPIDWRLSSLYLRMGSVKLSEAVQRTVKVNGNKRSKTAETSRFMGRLQERRQLVQCTGIPQSRINKSGVWIISSDTTIVVKEVREIVEELRLGSQTVNQKITCSVKGDSIRGGGQYSTGRKRKSVPDGEDIYITRNFKWADVGKMIGRLILKESTFSDSILITSILDSTLADLKDRGFPVEIAMKQKQPKRFKPNEPVEADHTGAAGDNKQTAEERAAYRQNIESSFRNMSNQLENEVTFSCRQISSNSLYSSGGATWAGSNATSTSPSENMPGCDVHNAHFLTKWKHIECGAAGVSIPVFYEVSNRDDCLEFLAKSAVKLDQFGIVLRELATICNVPVSCVAIFHEYSNTIAFNSKGSLYFNLMYFDVSADCNGNSMQRQSESLDDKRKKYSFWLVTFCHELAHNMEYGHTERHGQITETYMTMFFPKLLSRLSSITESESACNADDQPPADLFQFVSNIR